MPKHVQEKAGLEGVQFVVDKGGRKTAVLIDLKQHGSLWEDFYDAVLAEQRAKEPVVSFEEVKRRLRRAGKLNE